MRLLQDLTTMHLYDPYPSALVDIDIKRLAFAKNYSVIPDKDSLYLKALISMEKNVFQRQQFRPYQLFDCTGSSILVQVTTNAFQGMNLNGNLKSCEICDAAIAKYPNSIGGKIVWH
ncbi:MAG: hypothetical protein IPI31_03200 [Bacteroidetes bacterium]|nr:hypothetical protein [Bacteroidota bacterium]